MSLWSAWHAATSHDTSQRHTGCRNPRCRLAHYITLHYITSHYITSQPRLCRVPDNAQDQSVHCFCTQHMWPPALSPILGRTLLLTVLTVAATRHHIVHLPLSLAVVPAGVGVRIQGVTEVWPPVEVGSLNTNNVSVPQCDTAAAPRCVSLVTREMDVSGMENM